MAIEIYIISGFLGAGKTTFIRKLLKDTFQGRRVALIENDFGEISVDAALMRSGGLEVRELNSGCICCSLSGNFGKALGETVSRFNPDRIIIEPSGVGKLSAIEAALESSGLENPAMNVTKITVVDAGRCRMYLENFGEFFEDQIAHADTIVLSRAEDAGKAEKAVELIRGINSEAPIFSVPWDELDAEDVLIAAKRSPETPESGEHLCGHEHGDSCAHDHGAEETFDTVSMRTDLKYTPDSLRTRFSRLARRFPGAVLRAKGIVHGENGYLELQYAGDELKVTATETEGNIICFIGTGLSSTGLNTLFDGK
ncbi:MAG: GTP-binding protein [Oscillospiraceae bacterium]|nr:GTP-binding protein [Oscillospiraceae bacterium]